MRAAWAVLLVGLLSSAGCLGVSDGDIGEEGRPDDARTDLLFDWRGETLVGGANDMQSNPPPFMERPPRPECDGDNCERVPFMVPDLGGADVLVAIEWEAQDETYTIDTMPGGYLGSANLGLDLAIYRDGEMLVDAHESMHYAGVARLADPEPGEYVAEVVARWGEGGYLGTVVAVAADPGKDVPDGEPLLPDLVMLPADHLTITVPIGHELDAVLGAPSPGCGLDEILEDQERRCLRFAGILGNQGPGAFEANLQYDQAIASTGGNGMWEQRLFLKGGGEETLPIAPAKYHVVHGHYHILDFVDTVLHVYDEETGERGAETGFGRKTGFCIIDGGLIDPLDPKAEATYDGSGCCYLAGFCTLDMLSYDHFVMGISAGWYDIYPWWRADQYVEVTGLPDGTYELVSTINPDGRILESDTANNEASTVFRIVGDDIELLEQRTQADVGPHPDADWGYEG